MARPITLGNGEMLVCLDGYGLVSDLYFPYVGLENHITARRLHHRIGIWIDGTFSWLDDGSWDIKLEYQPELATGRLHASSDALGISIDTHDFVDSKLNVFARNLHVINHRNEARDVRVFWHQVFEISNSQTGGTAQYRPKDNLISHYKGERAFAIYAEDHDGVSADSYSVGLYGTEGREGTFRDAEDGELSCNAVEHGSVDSVLRVSSRIDGLSSARQHYWIAAGNKPSNAIEIHRMFKQAGIHTRHHQTSQDQTDKLSKSFKFTEQLPDRYRQALKQSVGIINTHIDKRGSVLASSDSDMLNYGRDYYHYCWPRDAAYVLYPLMIMGQLKPVRNFLDFCKHTIHPDGHMMHKYQADGALGSSWHPYIYRGIPELPIQEDETAAVVWLTCKYWVQTHDEMIINNYYDSLIRPMADFMCSYVDESTGLPHASYDLWEQKFLTTTYTTAIVIESLLLASKMAEAKGDNLNTEKWSKVANKFKSLASDVFWDVQQQYFVKGYYLNESGDKEYDKTLDSSSFYAMWRYKILGHDDDKMSRAYDTLRDQLTNPDGAGGYLRFKYDDYLRVSGDSLGNPWIITTLWTAQYAWRSGDEILGRELLDWAIDKASSTGMLSEQINPFDGTQISVAPLNWSQAELVYSILTFHALAL